MAYSFFLTVDDDNESFALGTYHDLDSHFKRGTINEVTELANKLEETVSGHIEEVSFEKCEKLDPDLCEECDGAGDCGDCNNADRFSEDLAENDEDDDEEELVGVVIPITLPSPAELLMLGAGFVLGLLVGIRK